MATDLQEAWAMGRILGRRLVGLMTAGYGGNEAFRAIWPSLERMSDVEHAVAASAALAETEELARRFDERLQALEVADG